MTALLLLFKQLFMQFLHDVSAVLFVHQERQIVGVCAEANHPQIVIMYCRENTAGYTFRCLHVIADHSNQIETFLNGYITNRFQLCNGFFIQTGCHRVSRVIQRE